MKNKAEWWLVLIAIIALALSQPLFLLLMWYWKISPTQAIASSELGALMGTIFTAGGLIVAIVSIYTMANIDRVARTAVEPLIEHLPQQIDARIRTFSQAYGYYLAAQQAARHGRGFENLEAVERSVSTAVALEPSLSGIYAWAGRTYYIASSLMYKRWILPMGFSDGSFPLPSHAQFPAMLEKAVSWLKKAQQRGDGHASEVAAELAELHGMMCASVREVISYIEVANAGTERLLPSGSGSLAMLFGACRTAADMDALSSALGIKVPLSAEQIRRLLLEHVAVPNRTSPFEVLALTKPDSADPTDPVSPGAVRIRWLGDGSTAYAEWLPRIQSSIVYQSDGIPAFGPADASGARATPAPIPIDDLLEKIIERFYVVSTLAWSRIPERVS